VIRTEFTLSFDDYTEWQSAFKPRRQARAPIIIIGCGLLLCIIGYLLPRFQCVPRLGIACFVAGLLTAALSIPVSLLMRPTPLAKSWEAKRDFEKFYKEACSFEASDSGWKYSYGTKENSRQWKDLFRFLQTGQTVVLMDMFNSYPIPLSALTTNQMNELQQLGKKALNAEGQFTVSMVATGSDFMIASAKHNWLRRTTRTVLLYLCGVLVLGTIGLGLADSSPSGVLSPWFLLCFLLLPVIEAAHYHSLSLAYWAHSYQDAEVLQDGICFNQGTVHNICESRKIQYEWFEEVVETRRALMLYLRKNSFFLIPKRGMNSEHLTRLRQLLETRKTGGQSR
jgi:hypothetical protein